MAVADFRLFRESYASVFQEVPSTRAAVVSFFVWLSLLSFFFLSIAVPLLSSRATGNVVCFIDRVSCVVGRQRWISGPHPDRLALHQPEVNNQRFCGALREPLFAPRALQLWHVLNTVSRWRRGSYRASGLACSMQLGAFKSVLTPSL